MSTILYSNGWLVTDSGGIAKQYDTYLVVNNDIDKLAVSTCGTVAVGICGRALIYADLIHSMSDNLASFLKDSKCDFTTSEDVYDYFREITFDHKADFSLLLINTIDYHAYEIVCEVKDGKFIFKVTAIRFQDTQSLGSGNFFAYAAVSLGYSPINAVKQAIKYDQFSKLPIKAIHISELSRYVVEDKL